MLLAQMHLALMFFAAKVRKPVVVVWEQRSLRDILDLDDKPHSLGVRDCTGGLGTTPFTGHYGVRPDHGPSASRIHGRAALTNALSRVQLVYYGTQHWSHPTQRGLFKVIDELSAVQPAVQPAQ